MITMLSLALTLKGIFEQSWKPVAIAVILMIASLLLLLGLSCSSPLETPRTYLEPSPPPNVCLMPADVSRAGTTNTLTAPNTLSREQCLEAYEVSKHVS